MNVLKWKDIVYQSVTPNGNIDAHTIKIWEKRKCNLEQTFSPLYKSKPAPSTSLRENKGKSLPDVNQYVKV